MTAPVARRGFTEEAVRELIERRDEPEWVRQRRLAAWTAYQEIPMPARTDEEWRRTDIRPLKLDDIQPYAEGSAPAGSLLPEGEHVEDYAGYIAIADGNRVEHHLREDVKAQGVIFTDLATAVREHAELVQQYFMTECVPPTDGKFAALHGAFWDNGTFLYVPRGVTVEAPFRTITTATHDGAPSFSHTLIVLDDQSHAIFAENFLSPTQTRQGLSSRIVELMLKTGSNLRYLGVQEWGRNVFDFHTERVLLGRDSQVSLETVELGSKLSKGRVESILKGDGANAKILGLYVEDSNQHLDRYTLQDHVGASGTSDLLFKGVLTDTARSVYSGLIRVRPNARQTAAYQQNRNLLLSRTARADSIPNLEIRCNDIIGCSHGATVGKVDEEQIFYLMTRGLDRVDATHLVVEGFVDPLVEAVPIPVLRDSLRREISRRVRGLQAE